MSRCPVCDHEVHVVGFRNVMHFDWKEIRVELAEVERLAFGDAARMASAASRAKEQASVSEWAQGWNDACLHLALQLAAKAKDLSDEIGAKVKP